LRSSFVPVAPMDRNGQFAAHDRAPRRGNCSGEPTITPRPIQSPPLAPSRRESSVEGFLCALCFSDDAMSIVILRPAHLLQAGRRRSPSFSDFPPLFLCVKSFDPAFHTKRNSHEPPFEYFRTGLNWAERPIDVPTPQRHTKSCSGLSKAPRMSAPPSPQCP